MLEKLYLVFGFFSFMGFLYLLTVGYDKAKVWFVKKQVQKRR